MAVKSDSKKPRGQPVAAAAGRRNTRVPFVLSPVVRIALLCGLLSLIYKAVLLRIDAFPFNSDEAVIALMARHILAGARPVFYYGQAYMGSLDAWLVAGAFHILGEYVLSIRVVQALLYAASTATTVTLAYKLAGSWASALMAGLLMAIPTVNVALYTTVTLGGYGETLLIGNLLILVALRIKDRPGTTWPYLIGGFLAGLGFWSFGLTLVYIIPVVILVIATLVKRTIRRMAVVRGSAFLLAAVLGAAPWLWHALGGGLAESLVELGGSAIAGASGGTLVGMLQSHLTNLALFGLTVVLGFRPPYEIRWLGMPVWPLIVLFWGLTGIFLIGRLRARSPEWWLLGGAMAALLLGFLLTPYGADPSGRYFLPLAAPMAVSAGAMLEHLRFRHAGAFGWGLLAVVVAFHAWGTIDSALRNPPRLTTQFDPVAQVDQSRSVELVRFLEQSGETRGYTNYWVAYPLAFLSQERLVFQPRLPYHQDYRYTARDDRYPPYGQLVDAAERVAFITTNHPALDARLRTALAGAGIAYEETWIGDFHVFHGLSRRTDPQALGLVP